MYWGRRAKEGSRVGEAQAPKRIKANNWLSARAPTEREKEEGLRGSFKAGRRATVLWAVGERKFFSRRGEGNTRGLGILVEARHGRDGLRKSRKRHDE